MFKPNQEAERKKDPVQHLQTDRDKPVAAGLVRSRDVLQRINDLGNVFL